MAEWSIASVLKTDEGHTSGGSNPSLSAKNESSNKEILNYQLVKDFFFYTIYSSNNGFDVSSFLLKKQTFEQLNYMLYNILSIIT